MPKFNNAEKNVLRNKNFERETFALNNKLEISDKIKMDFFDDVNKKSKLKQINRTVEEIMNQRNFLLFERRKKFFFFNFFLHRNIKNNLNKIQLKQNKRLKALLSSEDRAYEEELMSSAVSPLERAAQLREKAKQIRLNKENEKALFVHQKLEQKWRFTILDQFK